MGYGDPNIYYSPEKFGLEVVGELEYSSGSYEFDTRVVWKDKGGRFFTYRDAGCSCPTPFDGVEVDDLDDITGRVREFLVNEHRNESKYSRGYVSVESIDRLANRCLDV